MLRRCSPLVLVLLSSALVGSALVWSGAAHAQGPASSGSSTADVPPPPPPDSRAPIVGPAPSAAAGTSGAAGTAGAVGPAAAPSPAPGPARSPSAAPDAQPPADQGHRPASGGGAGENVTSAKEVFSDDWWGRARPIIELHGYFRTRAELFHNFTLGRHGSSLDGTDSQYLWPQPIDNVYTPLSTGTAKGPSVCGSGGNNQCKDSTESGANMRLRLDPEIHISDNLRILTQIDALDNVVLGSTPDAYAMQPAGGSTTMTSPTGYKPAGYNAYVPAGMFTTTQGPPTAGVNSFQNSINVKRIWGEYLTPLGLVTFGRMRSQWGLGMIANAGDGIDSDYQTTTDRVMVVSGIKSLDLYFGGAWDFPNSGPTSASPYDVYGGQPYNTCNLCNVNEWVAFIARRTNPEVQRLSLARGDVVLNGGLYSLFRSQSVDVGFTQTGATGNSPLTIDYANTNNRGLEARQAWAFIPDLWVQALWKKFRFEAEAATIQGQIGNSPIRTETPTSSAVNVRQYGVVTQTEYKAIEDKLDLQFGFGWASGDPWANTLNPPPGGLRPEANGAGPISTFQFHPDYRVDLIFFRHILTRVEGAYYFRPSVSYDFLHHSDGEKFGGGAAVIWSRASEFVQTPGHHRDLGVELDARLYYQSKDGSLNDDPSKIGGFFTMLEYGVFFPLGGLDYLPGESSAAASTVGDVGLSAAQTVRLFLGIVF
jgi:uncharacterized protein (TIGR04551 family)